MTKGTSGRVQHRVTLSNGRTLLVEESENMLHIASEDESHPGTPDAYIAQIDGNGVLVITNCGDAPRYLAEGLGRKYIIRDWTGKQVFAEEFDSAADAEEFLSTKMDDPDEDRQEYDIQPKDAD